MKIDAGNKVFLALVYATLMAQWLLTYATGEYLQKHPDRAAYLQKYLVLIVIAMLAAVVGVVVARRNVVVSVAMMAVFAVLSGILLQAAVKYVPAEVVRAAALGTAGIFLAMTALTFGGLDLSAFAGAMFIALTALVIGNIVTSLAGSHLQGLHKILVITGLVLFAAFVSLDTTQIISRDYAGNFAAAAFDLYLDTSNIFVSIVDLASGES